MRQLTSEGMNINITLLFAQEAYVAVAEAYIDGLEAALKAGKDISGIASVASFFVSRIDTLVDSIIDERLKTAKGSTSSSSSTRCAAKLRSPTPSRLIVITRR